LTDDHFMAGGPKGENFGRAEASEGSKSQHPYFMATQPHRFTADLTPRNTFTMQASTGQKIVVHTDTGEVDLCGLEPSEGARLFWDAVRRAGVPPGVKPFKQLVSADGRTGRDV
jgi:hypothetical protein